MAPSDVSQLRPPPRLDRVPGPETERVTAPDSEPRHAVLVIGMHRSGTSAFTRVLSLCGARLPESLMPAGERNPRGYFESQRIYQLHEEMLAEAGSAWDDIAPFPAAWFDSPLAPAWIDRMADAVRAEFGDSRLVTLKDPRIARLIPFWLRVLEQAGYQPSFVIPVRSPLDVAASLSRAEGMPPAKALLLWLGHLLAAERDTREHRRSFVSYDGLIEDWRRVVARISEDLAIIFPRATPRAAAEIDDFLAAELRHHASAPADVAERWSVPDWVKAAYEWAVGAAAGEPMTPDVLDALGAAVWPAELAFGPAVAAVELARDQAADEVRRLHARTERLATEVEELGAQLADAAREAANAREDLARREQESARIVEWLKLLLAWAMRAVHGGEATEDHIAAVMQATDAEFGGAAQIAALGIRLSHQTTEMARLAEEADLSAAEAERLAREIAALRAEIERREPERAELAQLREAVAAQIAALATQTREAERANQQVRGLWQQLTARDGETARLREQVAERDGLRQRVRELEPLRDQVAELDGLRQCVRELEPLRDQVAELDGLRRQVSELETLRGQVAELDGLRRQVVELERVSTELADAWLAAAAHAAALAKVQDELSAASVAVAERDLYTESLQMQIATVERSRLWRAVRPLARLGRDAGAIFRR